MARASRGSDRRPAGSGMLEGASASLDYSAARFGQPCEGRPGGLPRPRAVGIVAERASELFPGDQRALFSEFRGAGRQNRNDAQHASSPTTHHPETDVVVTVRRAAAVVAKRRATEGTVAEPVATTNHATGAGGRAFGVVVGDAAYQLSSIQSAHHSSTLPCMSYSPNGLAGLSPAARAPPPAF